MLSRRGLRSGSVAAAVMAWLASSGAIGSPFVLGATAPIPNGAAEGNSDTTTSTTVEPETGSTTPPTTTPPTTTPPTTGATTTTLPATPPTEPVTDPVAEPSVTTTPTTTPTAVATSTTVPPIDPEGGGEATTESAAPGQLVLPSYPNLRATDYDDVFAEGVPIGVVLAATRRLESGDDYAAQAIGSTASGAYQITDSMWNGADGYERAVDAPPDVQDRVAYQTVARILKEHDGDVSQIPLVWHLTSVSSAALRASVAGASPSDAMTPSEYQSAWMAGFTELLRQGAPPVLPADIDPLIPSIAFPLLGPISYDDGWHNLRDNGTRVHEGTDLIAERGQPLRAAFSGEVVRLVRESSGISGVSIEIRRDDDLRAIYRHVNDDSLGTNDGRGDQAVRIHPDIEVGARVEAGQIIGYNGNSGKSGYVPHLHFELRNNGTDRVPLNPYPALLEAEQREQCTIGIGPWSTATGSTAVRSTAAFDEASATLIEGPDGARWTVGVDGTVRAAGPGALITPNRGGCDAPDGELWFGTDVVPAPSSGDAAVVSTDDDPVEVHEAAVAIRRMVSTWGVSGLGS